MFKYNFKLFSLLICIIFINVGSACAISDINNLVTENESNLNIKTRDNDSERVNNYNGIDNESNSSLEVYGDDMESDTENIIDENKTTPTLEDMFGKGNTKNEDQLTGSLLQCGLFPKIFTMNQIAEASSRVKKWTDNNKKTSSLCYYCRC